MVACNATICLPILGAWVFTENSPNRKQMGLSINSSTHWKLKKITTKSLKSKLQWPHRRRSLAWLSSMRLGHHQWCRIQNSLQPQGPPDLTQGIPCHDGVVCLSHKKRLPRLCPSFTKKSSKSRVMAPKRKAQRSDSPGNDANRREFPKDSPQDFGAMTIYLWCMMILRNCHFIEKKICYQHTSLSCEWKLGTTVGKTVAAPLWDVWSQWSPAGAHAVSSAPLNAVQLARDPTM